MLRALTEVVVRGRRCFGSECLHVNGSSIQFCQEIASTPPPLLTNVSAQRRDVVADAFCKVESVLEILPSASPVDPVYGMSP